MIFCYIVGKNKVNTNMFICTYIYPTIFWGGTESYLSLPLVTPIVALYNRHMGTVGLPTAGTLIPSHRKFWTYYKYYNFWGLNNYFIPI